MSTWRDTGIGAHVASVDLAENVRVEMDSSGELTLAPATKTGIGTTKYAGESGKPVGVVYWNKPGTVLETAQAAIAVNDTVVAGTNGRVQTLPTAAGTYYQIGRALSAAGEAGDYVEILPHEVGKEITVSS